MAFVIGIHGEDYDETDTWSNPDHTLTTAGQQVVAVHVGAGPRTNCAYNGEALTGIVSSGYLRLWGLLKTHTATNGSVDYSPDAGPGVAASYALIGLKSLTPYDSESVNGSAASRSITVDGAMGYLVIAGMYIGQDWSMGMAVGGGSIQDCHFAFGANKAGEIGHYTMTGSTCTVDFTWSGGTIDYWGGVAVLVPTRLAGSPMWWS